MFEEGADKSAAQVACGNLVALFEASLRLLHPVMPFITEEIWHAIYDGKPPLKSIALAAFPQADPKADRPEVRDAHGGAAGSDRQRAQFARRNEGRAQGEGADPDLRARAGDSRADRAESRSHRVDRQANVESIAFVETSLAKLPGARHTARFDVHVVYEQKIDVAAECARLKKELEKLEKDIASGSASWATNVSWRRLPPTWWKACASREQRTKSYARRR